MYVTAGLATPVRLKAMSLRITTSDWLSRKQADTFIDGYEFVASRDLIPDCFITVRWSETCFASDPFLGLQKIIERLRKLGRPGPFVLFWNREREQPGVIEHAHIAYLRQAIAIVALEDLICRWAGVEKGSGAVDVSPCKKSEWCNARTLITGYLLKGLPPQLRIIYLTPNQQRAWRRPQGAIRGKRLGVSNYVSRGVRGLRNSRIVPKSS